MYFRVGQKDPPLVGVLPVRDVLTLLITSLSAPNDSSSNMIASTWDVVNAAFTGAELNSRVNAKITPSVMMVIFARIEVFIKVIL